MEQHPEAGGLATVGAGEYLVVIEGGAGGYSGYAPDLPIVVAAGDTREEVEELMRKGVALYLATLREKGEPIPAPATTAIVVAGLPAERG